jgi:hypothetical protein
MFGLILAIECWAGRNWLTFSDPVSLSWRFSAQAASTRARGCQILILGDSLAKHGLVPAVLEVPTGTRVLNISAARGPTLLSYFLLRRALDAGARPSAVVLNAKPAVLIGGPEYDARYWQELLTPRECWELFRLTGRAPFILSTCVGRLLPSFRARLEVRSKVMAALRGETDPLHAINRVLWRNWTVNAGANVTAADSPYRGEIGSDVESRLHPSRFYVDRTNALAIERLLKLAATENIPVYWLLTPISPKLQALRDQSGAEARYEQFVRAMQGRYPHVVTVLDGRRAAYAPTLFVDETHLSGRGAAALSSSVAAAIGPLMSRSPVAPTGDWIALGSPPSRSAQVAVPTEDLDESRRRIALDVNAHSVSR